MYPVLVEPFEFNKNFALSVCVSMHACKHQRGCGKHQRGGVRAREKEREREREKEREKERER